MAVPLKIAASGRQEELATADSVETNTVEPRTGTTVEVAGDLNADSNASQRDLGAPTRSWYDLYLLRPGSGPVLASGRRLSDPTAGAPGSELVGVDVTALTNTVPAVPATDLQSVLEAIDSARTNLWERTVYLFDDILSESTSVALQTTGAGTAPPIGPTELLTLPVGERNIFGAVATEALNAATNDSAFIVMNLVVTQWALGPVRYRARVLLPVLSGVPPADEFELGVGLGNFDDTTGAFAHIAGFVYAPSTYGANWHLVYIDVVTPLAPVLLSVDTGIAVTAAENLVLDVRGEIVGGDLELSGFINGVATPTLTVPAANLYFAIGRTSAGVRKQTDNVPTAGTLIIDLVEYVQRIASRATT